MKTATSSLALLAALLAAPAAAEEYTVTSCADLAEVDDSLVTSITIDGDTFACEEYTRFPVRNTMSLKATGSTVEFSNLSLKVLGELTVEPDVVFTGVADQVNSGGVLYVDEDATATFKGTSEFNDNSILLQDPDNDSSAFKKGGAVHNKGMLTFDGDATFARNEAHSNDHTDMGMGGAISNVGKGTILFKSKLTVEDSVAEGWMSSIGGGVYNRGNIVVDGESTFTNNVASDGGAIYQTAIGTMTFNAMATFSGNQADDMFGGAIMNDGGSIEFKGGSVFDGNSANGSGDGGAGGAIFNAGGGVIEIEGGVTFSDNGAYWGGAIYSYMAAVNTRFGDEDAPSANTTWDDATFIDNDADYCPDTNYGDDEACSA